jgi:glucose-1-phosphate thymidylyltransferase
MFDALPSIDEVIFIVGYLGEQVEEYVAQAYPHLNARYVVQEEMLGQSHALWLARESLEGPMLMVFVDTIIETDLSNISFDDVEALAWVKEVSDPRRFGVAKVDSNGIVTQLIEKPDDMSINLALVGFYCFQSAERLLQAIEEQMNSGEQLKGEFYLADAINLMLRDGLKMRTQPVEVWQDCGKPETLLETNRFLLQHGRDNSETSQRDGVVVVPPVSIDPSAVIQHSVIGPNVTIAADCSIQRSIIQDSIVDIGSHIVDAMLSQSLIGRDAKVLGRDRSFNVGDSSEIGFA